MQYYEDTNLIVLFITIVAASIIYSTIMGNSKSKSACTKAPKASPTKESAAKKKRVDEEETTEVSLN